jgi:hypothetical protein
VRCGIVLFVNSRERLERAAVSQDEDFAGNTKQVSPVGFAICGA